MNPDFTLHDHGNIWLLTALNDAAAAWTHEYLQGAMTYAGGIVIEHRFVSDIVEGIESFGLTIGEIA